MEARPDLPYGRALRRFFDHRPPDNPSVLAPGHPAAIEARTRYPATVKDAKHWVRVFKSGGENRKIGAQVTKGRWKGMPVFTLGLEERATCPRSCRQWLDCYGNKMPFTARFRAGAVLERQIGTELRNLQRCHPGGFVIRLHVVGDFYDFAYTLKWSAWLRRFPALRVFGYTARDPDTDPVGALLWYLAETHWDRFAMRFSNGPVFTSRAAVVDRAGKGALVCPAQTGRTDCCGTCALCWQSRRDITFLRH